MLLPASWSTLTQIPQPVSSQMHLIRQWEPSFSRGSTTSGAPSRIYHANSTLHSRSTARLIVSYSPFICPFRIFATLWKVVIFSLSLTTNRSPMPSEDRSFNHSPRQARQLGYISQLTSDVRHLPGSANGAADTLSRLDMAALSLPSPIDLPTLSKAQRDEDIATAVKDTSLVLQPVAITATDFTLLCDMATGVPRPYVPEKLRCQLYMPLHGLSHPGIHAT